MKTREVRRTIGIAAAILVDRVPNSRRSQLHGPCREEFRDDLALAEDRLFQTEALQQCFHPDRV